MFDFYIFENLISKSGASKSKLCSLVGKSPGYIRDLKKSGKEPPIETIKIWADALNTTPAYLMGKTDKKEAPTSQQASGSTELEKEFLEQLRGLPEADRQKIMDYMHLLRQARANNQ